MSRVSPFPTPKRTHSPVRSGETQPLQISRTRSTTPGSSYSANGPTRPQRSDLRSRQVSEHSVSSADTRDSRDQRDSASTQSSTPRWSTARTPKASSRQNTGPAIAMPLEDESPRTPLSAALSAFQSAGQRKRAMTNGTVESEREQEREREIQAEQSRQKRIKDRVPGRRMNGKAKPGDIDAVLDQIKDEWESVISADFNPVDLALQLLDDSSLGKDMGSFRDTKTLLSRALKGSVDKHYQAFAAALPHHASLLTQMNNTQQHIRDARTSLQDAKDALGNKRADLVQLWSRGQTLEEMTRILDQIEHLKTVPDALESLISEKRLLQAAVLLVRSLKVINNQDMNEIGAVADLRTYLNGQETALREILVDELHSHIYLKSVFTGTRWSAYTPGQQTLPKMESEEEFAETAEATPVGPESQYLPERFNRFIAGLSIRPNDSPMEVDDHLFHSTSSGPSNTSGGLLFTGPSFGSNLNLAAAMSNSSHSTRGPESDSFSYMETLLESLAVLSKLGSGLDVVAQRVPGEIFTLIETTLDEVSERADYLRRASTVGPQNLGMRTDDVYVITSAAPGSFGLTSIGAHMLIGPTHAGSSAFLNASSLRVAALEESTKQMDHEILKDFFWTLYSKLDAVTQSLRVVSEVANRIGSRRDFKDSSGAKLGALFPLNEIVIPIHAEIRTLLSDYLTDEEQGSVSGRNPLTSINETLREGKFGRDRSKNVFRFADGDVKATTKTLRQHEDELNRILKETVPGLVTSPAEGSVQATLSAVGTDDRMIGPGRHHRLLIRPDAFHVSILFQPTLAFLQRMADVLPSGLDSARQSSGVMDEFVLKVYLPQLEEKISMLFLNAVNGIYAFQPDTASSRLSPQPLIKATTQLVALINSLCAMLRTSPFHKENYSRLILTVVIQFYQRCSDRFQDLIVTKDDTAAESKRVTLAAEWAQKQDLQPCLSEIMRLPELNTSRKEHLYRQETSLELNFLDDGGTVEKYHLIESTRNLSTLGSLYTSVCWLTTALNDLKATPEPPFSPMTPFSKLESAVPMSAVTPYTAGLPFLAPIVPGESLQLPLSKEMSMRFQALLQTYNQLAEFILFTIRMDVRCRAIHYLDLAMRHGNYYIEREASEPDPHIIDLNSELGKCVGFLSNAVPEREHTFIFEGLGQLLEHLLILKARFIRLANANGIKKMFRNILALQQSIKTITITSDSKDADFERAKRYYSLFFGAPANMLEGIKAKQEFTFEEYQVMLKLQCGVDQTMGDAGASHASDKGYGMHLIDLQRLEMESSNEDDQ